MSASPRSTRGTPLTGYAAAALLIAVGVCLVVQGRAVGWGIVACAVLFLPVAWNGLQGAFPLRELGAIRGIVTLGVVVLGALSYIQRYGGGGDTELTRGGGGPPPDLNALEDSADPAKGRYVALLFAAEAYEHWQPLDRPIDDANALKALLTTRYTFAESDVRLVTNPTREDIISALDELSTTLGPEDNLLIYYAGHGAIRKAGKQGSWIPVDGETGSRSSRWVSSDDIVTRLNGLAARHILLLVDACFGGTILSEIGGTRGGELDPGAVKQIYTKRSRKAMTSGAAEEVSDASPFMQLIRSELGNNRQQVLLATQLFSAVQDSLVRMDYGQAPQFSNILTDGNDGGDFVFVRKDR